MSSKGTCRCSPGSQLEWHGSFGTPGYCRVDGPVVFFNSWKKKECVLKGTCFCLSSVCAVEVDGSRKDRKDNQHDQTSSGGFPLFVHIYM